MGKEMNYFVYKITFPSNKVYIGCTNNPDRRMGEHRCQTCNRLIGEQIKKYGWGKAEMSVLDKYESKDYALEKESDLIAYYSEIGMSLNYVGNDRIPEDLYENKKIPSGKMDRLYMRINSKLKERFIYLCKSRGETPTENLTRHIEKQLEDSK